MLFDWRNFSFFSREFRLDFCRLAFWLKLTLLIMLTMLTLVLVFMVSLGLNFGFWLLYDRMKLSLCMIMYQTSPTL